MIITIITMNKSLYNISYNEWTCLYNSILIDMNLNLLKENDSYFYIHISLVD